MIGQIHQAKKGSSVGYNNEWSAPKAIKIETLPLGHADGVGRHFGYHQSTVSINGFNALIVGNFYMGMLMINVTRINYETDDEVTFFDSSK